MKLKKILYIIIALIMMIGMLPQITIPVYAEGESFSACGGQDVTLDFDGFFSIYANGNPIIIADGETGKSKVYLDTNGNGKIDDDETPLALNGLDGNVTDGYDLLRVGIFGGSKEIQVTDTQITMLGGKVFFINGGGLGADGTVTGNAKVTVTGGEPMWLYGGGKYGANVSGNTEVNISGTSTKIGFVFGGGEGSDVLGNVNMTISEAEFIPGGYDNLMSIGGGCYWGTVYGDVNLNVSKVQISGSVYGGGYNDKVIGSINFSISDLIAPNCVAYGSGFNCEAGNVKLTLLGNNTVFGIYGISNSYVTGNVVVQIGADTLYSYEKSLLASGMVEGDSHFEYEAAFYNEKNGAKYSDATEQKFQWVNEGETATEPPAPDGEDKIFDGWKKVSDDTAYDFSLTATEPVKLYATWKMPSIEQIDLVSNKGIEALLTDGILIDNLANEIILKKGTKEQDYASAALLNYPVDYTSRSQYINLTDALQGDEKIWIKNKADSTKLTAAGELYCIYAFTPDVTFYSRIDGNQPTNTDRQHGGAVKTFEVQVNNGVASVNIAMDKKSQQTGEVYGTNKDDVVFSDDGNSLAVNTQSIAQNGGSKNFVVTINQNYSPRILRTPTAPISYDITVKVAEPPKQDGPSGRGGSSSSSLNQSAVIVIVNGKEQNAGKETKYAEGGKTAVRVDVDNKVIEIKIDEAIKNNPSGVGNIVQVPVLDTNSEIVKVGLTGDIIKKLEDNTFDISVKRDNIEYIIPAKEFTIGTIAEQLGVQEKSLADIKVEVKITKLDETVVKKYNEVAKENRAELVFPPVEFEITAKTTKADGTTSEAAISKFSNYVERIMEIPKGVDPSKITTGIVFNPDGTYSHVPTEVFQKDGKWYAKLNSLTNSDYSVIWNPVTVKSVENHWAKDAVNDMASRLVIFNPERFEPEKAITRAEFAEYIVRALGLYREGTEHKNAFNDVSSTGERTLAILIANEYGVVTGYPDGTFRPDQTITREEAMTMYQRAMKITKLSGSDEARYKNYTDFAKVSAWAKIFVQEVLSAHVFNGTSTTTISPQSNLIYAEAAQAIKNLLVESKLINK